MAIVLPVINLNESDNIYTIHTNSHLGGVAVALVLQPTLGQTDSKKTSTDTGCMRGSSLLDALTARDMRPLRW